MVFILNSDDYDSVREILGVTSDDVDDRTIERTPYLPMAEAEVKAKVADWAAIQVAGGSDLVCLKAAIEYRVAAALCDRLANTQRSGERVGDYGAGSIDWAAQKTAFLRECETSLGRISTQTRTAPTLVMMAGISRTTRANRDLDPLAESDFENI